jgi:hypothetical protein
MLKSNFFPKISQTNTWSFIFAFVALSSVQISYVFGGLAWLDAFAFLLIPSLVLFIISFFRSWDIETKDYCVGLTLVTTCVAAALFFKYKSEVGIADDNYHNAKIVALSIKNSFFTAFQYIKPSDDIRFYYLEFIESIWGIFWRWTHWDFIVVIFQTLPIFLLWQQLLQFFRRQNVTTIPAFLSAVIVISSPLLWSQQGSTYNDSVAGMFGAIVLLLCYDLLKHPSQRHPFSLVSLSFISGLCLVSKPTTILVGLTGLVTAFSLGFRCLPAKSNLILLLTSLPSVIYLFYHQGQVWIKKGNPFYPGEMSNMIGQEFRSWYHYYYESDPIYGWIRDHAFNFKPFYILASWLMDYKYDKLINADPWIRGNGLVFGYFVVPILLIWFIKDYRYIFNYRNWKNPCLFILGVTLFYYISFSGSLGPRFSLCFNILILAWCMSWFWRNLENWPIKWSKALSTILLCIILVLATISYGEANLKKDFEPKIVSPLEAQRRMFPTYVITMDFRKELIQHMYQQYRQSPSP